MKLYPAGTVLRCLALKLSKILKIQAKLQKKEGPSSEDPKPNP